MLTDDLDGAADTWAFFRHPGTSDHDDRRMSVRPPLRSRPVQNVETITSLIVVAATLLDADVRGGAFTPQQLVQKMRGLLRPRWAIAADDVRAVAPGLGTLLAPV